MTVLPEILILAVLLVIAAELYLISRELGRATMLLLKERESAEGKAAGPTINVNLGQTPAGPSGTPPAVVVETQKTAESADSGKAFGQPVQEAPVPRAKPTPSGILVVKCPKCQSENSSYRKECFNCGGPL